MKLLISLLLTVFVGAAQDPCAPGCNWSRFDQEGGKEASINDTLKPACWEMFTFDADATDGRCKPVEPCGKLTSCFASWFVNVVDDNLDCQEMTKLVVTSGGTVTTHFMNNGYLTATGQSTFACDGSNLKVELFYGATKVAYFDPGTCNLCPRNPIDWLRSRVDRAASHP